MSNSPLPNSTATSKVVSRRMYSFCQSMGKAESLKIRGKSAIRITPACALIKGEIVVHKLIRFTLGKSVPKHEGYVQSL